MDNISGLILATILGLGWGSFATMAIYRLPHGLPWIGKKPFCPHCNHDLTFKDYVSLISYISRSGHCRYCGVSYDRRGIYLLTEIAVTLVFIISFLVFNMSETFLMVTSLGTALMILAVIHLQHGYMHTKPLLIIAILAIAARAAQDGSVYGIILDGILGALLGLGIRHVIFGLKGNFQQSMDYLQYKERGRFSGAGLSPVML
jgi:prepilin signal peptidase PulO-like enzyme (type II secretory pathway)